MNVGPVTHEEVVLKVGSLPIVFNKGVVDKVVQLFGGWFFECCFIPFWNLKNLNIWNCYKWNFWPISILQILHDLDGFYQAESKIQYIIEIRNPQYMVQCKIKSVAPKCLIQYIIIIHRKHRFSSWSIQKDSKSLLDTMILLTTPWLFGRLWKNFPTLSDNIIMMYRDYRWSSPLTFIFTNHHHSSSYSHHTIFRVRIPTEAPNRSGFAKQKKTSKLHIRQLTVHLHVHPLPAPTVVKLNENSNIEDGFWEKKHWPANLQVLLLKLYRLPRFIVDTRQEKNTCDDFWSHGHAKK